MENNTNGSIFNFEFDDESKSNLSGIAQWANINAIVGLAGILISVISTAVTLFQINRYGGSGSAFASALITLLIGLVVSLLLNITLLYAALYIKKGLQLTSQQHFVTGISKLSSFFKIYGILMIIVLVLVVLGVLIAALVGSLSRGY